MRFSILHEFYRYVDRNIQGRGTVVWLPPSGGPVTENVVKILRKWIECVSIPALYYKIILLWLFSLMGPSQSISTNLSYITNVTPNKFSKPDLTSKPPQQHGPVKRSGNGRGQQVKSLIVYPSKITIHYRSDNLSVAGAIGSEAWLGQQTRLSPPHATPCHAIPQDSSPGRV